MFILCFWQIKYSTTEEGDESLFLVLEDSETLSGYVTGLKKFVEYRLQVLAFTRIGDGSLSTPPVIVKTHEDGKLMNFRDFMNRLNNVWEFRKSLNHSKF